VAVPCLWLVPDWIGSGDPLHAGQVAGSLDPHGLRAALAALGEGMAITPVPLSLTAVAGVAIAWRHGDRRVVELSGLAAAWAGLLLALMAAGYPSSGRFFVLPAALVCVLGAGGAVRAVRVTGRTRLAALAAVAALPLVAPRALTTDADAGDAVRRARVETELARAIDRAGPQRLRQCGTPVLPRGLSWLRGEVAWRLGLPLGRVRSVPTSGDSYLASLSRFGTGAVPRAVTVSAHSSRQVVLDPFGSTPVQVSSPTLDLDVAARAGSWRVLVPDRGSCRRIPTRVV